MKTRTWPYGTKHEGKVVNAFKGEGRMKAFHLVEDLTAEGEGHVLSGGAQDSTAKIGDYGELTFTKGGPTGGFWKFVKYK